MEKRLFTSESVTEGHPDKICDQISDAILDAILDKDPEARVACEVSVGTGLVLVNGEISTSAYVDIQSIVRETVKEIGYTRGKYGFDAENLAVLVTINEQSPDIAQGVNESLEKRESKDSELDLGAGDQGCIKFDSLIKTDRGLIPINKVKVTDKVLTRNGYNNIKDVRKTGTLSTIKLTTNLGRELELTPDHKVLVDGGEWVEAKDTLNRTVFIDHSSFNYVDSFIEKIVSIEDSGTHDVYDIEVETNHEFFANGILVHNCMFGFACNETDELMPLPIILSHKLSKGLSDLRKTGKLKYLRPDGKTQVTVEYDENDIPLRVDTIVISTQHDENVSQEQIHEDMIQLIKDIVPSNLLDSETKYFINPTGRFVIGGPKGDAGLTGRKIIVDTYGGYARHGGGAFSGKDATKVDRSGAYAARYIAKNIVGAGLADKCEIQLSYAIGVSTPISIRVDTFNTGKVDSALLVKAIRNLFDLRPRGIIEMLDLKRPIYKQTASYGHFGRNDLDLPWERLDKIDDLLNFLNNN